jgi:hypothetical protein
VPTDLLCPAQEPGGGISLPMCAICGVQFSSFERTANPSTGANFYA